MRVLTGVRLVVCLLVTFAVHAGGSAGGEAQEDASAETVPKDVKDMSDDQLFDHALALASAQGVPRQVMVSGYGRLLTTLFNLGFDVETANRAITVFCTKLNVALPVGKAFSVADAEVPWAGEATAVSGDRDVSLLRDAAALQRPPQTLQGLADALGAGGGAGWTTARDLRQQYSGLALSRPLGAVLGSDAMAAALAARRREPSSKTESDGTPALYDFQLPRCQQFCVSATAELERWQAAEQRLPPSAAFSFVAGGDCAAQRLPSLAFTYEGNANFRAALTAAMTVAMRHTPRREIVAILNGEHLSALGVLLPASRRSKKEEEGAATALDEFRTVILTDLNAAFYSGLQHNRCPTVPADSAEATREEHPSLKGWEQGWMFVEEDVFGVACPLLHHINRAAAHAQSAVEAANGMRRVFLRIETFLFNAPRHVVSVTDADVVLVMDVVTSRVLSFLRFGYHLLHRYFPTIDSEPNAPMYLKTWEAFARSFYEEGAMLSAFLQQRLMQRLAHDVPSGSVAVVVYPVESCVDLLRRNGTTTRKRCWGTQDGSSEAVKALGQGQAPLASFSAELFRPLRRDWETQWEAVMHHEGAAIDGDAESGLSAAQLEEWRQGQEVVKATEYTLMAVRVLQWGPARPVPHPGDSSEGAPPSFGPEVDAMIAAEAAAARQEEAELLKE